MDMSGNDIDISPFLLPKPPTKVPSMASEADALILLLVAFIFPPAAVVFVTGCSVDLCLNILLTLLGYFPGLIHAFWLVMRRTDANERYGYKNWTYTGMGEYAPIHPRSPVRASYPASYILPPLAGAPPPPGQNPAYQAPPPGQAPVDPKLGGNGYTSQAPVDQKSGGQAPPSAPPEHKYDGYQGSSQVPAEEKAVNVVPLAYTDQKVVDPTAPPSGT